MKKFLQIPLLLVALFLSSIPISAHDFEVDGIYYNYLNKTAKTVAVTYKGSCYDAYSNEYTGSVTIPSSVTYNGTTYSVTEIYYDAFKGCSGLTSVTIPNSVTEIGSSAFYRCYGLTSVTIPNSVTEIGSSAFYGCYGLTSVTIPNSVTEIGSSAFYGCSGLTSVTIPNSVTEIGNYAFYGCSGLTSVTIPSSVTEIGSSTFEGCSGLTSVTIPNSVTEIGYSAFEGCSGLTSVTIPNSVTEIGNYAFEDCEGLTSVTIPSSVTEIGYSAFEGCSGLKSISIPYSVTKIGGDAFYDTAWYNNQADGVIYINNVLYKYKGTMPDNTSINIKEGTASISPYAFEGCTGLTEVTIPNSVTEIGYSAFEGCSGLTSVTIPNSVTSIGSSAFYGCSGLTSVTIPNSVTEIGLSAFEDCSGLTSVTIPNSVTLIGQYAFKGCSGLTSVTIPNSVTNIYSNAFENCTNLKEIIAEKGNSVYFSHEGILYATNTNGDKYLHIYPLALTEEYVAPTFLTQLTTPNVKSIIISEGSNLKITVGDCSLLESLVINEPLDTILFYGKNLENAVNLKKLVLPTKMNCKSLAIHQTQKIDNNVGGDSYTYTFHPIEILQVPKLNIFSYICFEENGSLFNDHFTIVNGYSCSKYESSGGNRYAVYLPSSLKQLILTDQTDFYNDTKKCWYAFGNTGTIEGYSIDILKPVTNFQSTTFQNSAIRNISIDSAEIPAMLFRDCVNLKSLILPFPGIGTALSPSNFGELFGTEKNDKMRAVTQFFEDGTNKTYYLPTGLEELTLTEGCEIIPYGGLYNCNMLKTITLPTSLYMVGEKAFYGCAKITDIYCKGADPAVAYDNSFDGMRLTSCKLHVPYNSSERYKISDGWKRFYYIEEEAPLVISIAKSIENAGVVYGINEYQPGQVAEIEAVAHSGYTFVGWYENDNLLTTDSKYSLMVTESHSLVAMFAPILDENNVDVSPTGENVSLSWEAETSAKYYDINIYSDATMTMQVGNIVVDNNGQVLSRSTSTTISTTIDGLNEMQNYYYSITAYNEEELVLSKYIGSFSTNAGVDAIININNTVEVARYDIHGRLLSEPTKGINIVKYSDGTTCKECVK